MKLINSTINGQIFLCPCQNKLFLEFGNMFMQVTYDELGLFSEYVNSIDYKFWLAKNQNAQNRRRLLPQLSVASRYAQVSEASGLPCQLFSSAFL